MSRQEDLEVIKAISNFEPSPVFLRELRKGLAAGKKKAIAAFKANATSSSTLERQSGVGSDYLTSREYPQIPVSKRKVDEISSSDGSRRPAPGRLFGTVSRPRAPRANLLPRAARNSEGPKVGWRTLRW
jgi:hypothetical protein